MMRATSYRYAKIQRRHWSPEKLSLLVVDRKGPRHLQGSRRWVSLIEKLFRKVVLPRVFDLGCGGELHDDVRFVVCAASESFLQRRHHLCSPRLSVGQHAFPAPPLLTGGVFPSLFLRDVVRKHRYDLSRSVLRSVFFCCQERPEGSMEEGRSGVSKREFF